MVFLWQDERKNNKNTQTKTPDPLVERQKRVKHSKRAQEKRTRKEKYFVEATYWRQQGKVSGNDVQVLALAWNNNLRLICQWCVISLGRRRNLYELIFLSPRRVLLQSERKHFSFLINPHHAHLKLVWFTATSAGRASTCFCRDADVPLNKSFQQNQNRFSRFLF